MIVSGRLGPHGAQARRCGFGVLVGDLHDVGVVLRGTGIRPAQVVDRGLVVVRGIRVLDRLRRPVLIDRPLDARVLLGLGGGGAAVLVRRLGRLDGVAAGGGLGLGTVARLDRPVEEPSIVRGGDRARAGVHVAHGAAEDLCELVVGALVGPQALAAAGLQDLEQLLGGAGLVLAVQAIGTRVRSALRRRGGLVGTRS